VRADVEEETGEQVGADAAAVGCDERDVVDAQGVVDERRQLRSVERARTLERRLLGVVVEQARVCRLRIEALVRTKHAPAPCCLDDLRGIERAPVGHHAPRL
jgi:hypothetical protein